MFPCGTRTKPKTMTNGMTIAQISMNISNYEPQSRSTQTPIQSTISIEEDDNSLYYCEQLGKDDMEHRCKRLGRDESLDW